MITKIIKSHVTRGVITIVALLVAMTATSTRLRADGESSSINEATFTDQRLAAVDGAASDAFGEAVAISGNTALVGSPLSDVNGKADQGVVYVYVYENNVWTAQAKLIAPDGNPESHFGYTLGIDGDTIVVGARRTDPANKGAAYVFVRSGINWAPQAKLTASDGIPGDRFGEAVAISGSTIVVGAALADIPGTPDKNRGAAYVFVRTGNTWTQQAKLTANEARDYDFFGTAVAIDGDTALIGAPEDNGDVQLGAAYVFTRVGTSWTERARLQSKDLTMGDGFGGAVSLDGETAVVAAAIATEGGDVFQGAAYIFTGSGANWSQQAKLIPDDGASSSLFGFSVSLKGEQVVIGAAGHRIGGHNEQGSAYLFTRTGSLWSETSEFIAASGAASDRLGAAVAIDGDFIFAGTPQRNVNLFNNVDTQQHGAAYVFSNKISNTAPTIQAVNIKGKKLIVTGTRFESPTQIYVDGEKQKKTFNDDVNPGTTVVANKAGRFIAPGQTVKVQVKNANTGETSNEFLFTRPNE